MISWNLLDFFLNQKCVFLKKKWCNKDFKIELILSTVAQSVLGNDVCSSL